MRKQHIVKKNFIPKIFLLLAISISAMFYVWYIWTTTANEQIESTLQIARSIEANLPIENLQALETMPSDIDKPQYQALKKALKATIKVNPEARFAYIYTEKNGKIYFVADSEPEDSKEYSPPGQEYPEAKSEDKQPFRDGKELITSPLTDRWGTWRSVLIPVKDEVTGETIAIFGMDFNSKSWNKQLLFKVIQLTLVILLLLTFLLVLQSKGKNTLLLFEITERKKIEEELKNSLDRNKALVKANPDMMFVFDSECRIIDFHSEPNNQLFVKPETFLGKIVDDSLPPEVAIVTHQKVENVLSTGKPEYSTYELQMDSELRFYESRYVPCGKKDVLAIVRDITERKRADKVLEESEKKFRTVVEEAAEIVFTTNSEGYFTYANPRGIKLSGYSLEELTKLKYIDLVVPEYKLIVKRNYFKQYINRIALSTTDYPFRTKSGEIRWFNQNASLIIENDNVIGFYVIARDVTELRSMEAALKESEEKYRLIVENIGEGFGFVNAEEQFLLANKSAEQIFGVGSGELVGKNLNQFVSKDQFSVVQKETSIRIKGIQSVYELDILRPNNEKRTISVIAVPQNDKKGIFVGTYGMFRDITESKLAEESLHSSQQLIEGIINAMPVRIFWKDRNSVYLGCNSIFARDAGFSDQNDIIGKDDFQMGWRDQAELYRSGDRQVMESGTPILLNEEPQTTPEGNTIILLTNKIPLKNSNGEIYGILGTSMNVTERIAAVQEIKLKNEQLQKLNAEKDKFFSIIAHDLRTPFNSFLGLTQIMAEDLRSLKMSQIQEIAVSISKSANNLYRLLENLLQWSQIQYGAIPFNPEAVQLSLVAGESIELIHEFAKSKGIEITYEIPDNSVVFADSNMLQTIIRNLISNAVKFTPKGGRVNLSAKATDDKYIEISIKDSGIGMNQTLINNLFRLDIKTNRTGTEGEPSSGLGLLLCKEFIEKHGGKIWVASEVGKGSEFYFTLPAYYHEI